MDSEKPLWQLIVEQIESLPEEMEPRACADHIAGEVHGDFWQLVLAWAWAVRG